MYIIKKHFPSSEFISGVLLHTLHSGAPIDKLREKTTIRPPSQVAHWPAITHDVNLAYSAEFICACALQAMHSAMKTVVLVQLKNEVRKKPNWKSPREVYRLG